MEALRIIGSIVCGIVGVGLGLLGLVLCLFSYTPPGGTLFAGQTVRIRSMDGGMDWGKLGLGVICVLLAIGAFVLAWRVWP
jgi:hypothetical protein